MVKGFQQIKVLTAAARALMEKGHVDARRGIYSRTIFAGGTKQDSKVEAAAIHAASLSRLNLVWLQFGTGSKSKGPSAYSVTMTDGAGGGVTTHDCGLVADEHGAFVLVPLGRVPATFHFAVGANGLEQRHGRPTDLAASAIRARRTLLAAARRAGPASSFLEIHTGEMRAA